MPTAAPLPDGEITFRPLEPADLPMLGRWLSEPHVYRWWHHDATPEALDRDFGAAMRGEDPGEDLVVEVGGEPVGLVQRCRWDDYPGELAAITTVVAVPPGAATVDYVIGRPHHTGRGLGPRIIAAAVAATFERYPDAPAIVVPVVAGNRASWRAPEKAGFRWVADGDLPPDNPADPPLHRVHRIDRPAARIDSCPP